MKKFINTIFAATLLALSAISCQKTEDSQTTNNSPEVPNNSPEVQGERTISVSLTATMDELTPAEGVKSGVTPVIRLTWASEGDMVFVYDASKCLGTLDVTLKNNDSRYAYLSGTIEAPSDGTEVLTCIHAKGLDGAPSVDDGKVTVSLAEQNGQDSEIPFVVFGTIDYDGQSSITDRLVNFSFATSVVNVNCIDLAMDDDIQEQIDKAYITGLNTACQLSLSGTAAPEVSGSDIGGITRKGIAGGSNKLAFLMSVPVSPVASERELYVVQQTKTMHSSFTKAAFAAGKFINVMYKLEPSSRVESVSLNTESIIISPEEEFTLIATVAPEETLIDVKWSSSDEDVATVDKNGKVKGLAAGTATITVTTADGEKTANCEVLVANTRVESVSLDNESKIIPLEEEFTLIATVMPEDASVKDVIWSSSDEDVAIVDKDGKVKGISEGTATITAATVDGGKTATCQIYVGIHVESISLNIESKYIFIDDEFTITATVLPEYALVKDVKWSSSDEDVATVDENGKVKGLMVGTSTITATTVDGEKTATCEVTVSIPVEKIIFVPQDSDDKATCIVKETAVGLCLPVEDPTFYFEIQPSSLMPIVAEFPSLLKMRYVNAITHAAATASGMQEMKITGVKVENGLLAVTCSTDKLSQSVFSGTSSVNVSLAVNDGEKEISSPFVELVMMRSPTILFNDPEFKAACVKKYDKDGDGEISISEGDAVTAMDMSDVSVNSAEGIEMFRNLTAVNFSGNSKLKTLNLSYNKPMTSLNVSGCSSLETLSLDEILLKHITCDFTLGHVLTLNGRRGVICDVTTEGYRKMLLLQVGRGYWDTSKNPVSCNATDQNDGMANTNKILAASNTCDGARWSRSFGVKYYMPAIGEIWKVYSSKEDIFRIVDEGSMELRVSVASSTEKDVDEYYTTSLSLGSGNSVTGRKGEFQDNFWAMRLL